MEAVIRNVRLLDAALMVSNDSYTLGTVQLKRKGDVMEVAGTEGYFLLIADAKCDFTDWEDGESIRIDGTNLTRSLKKLTKKCTKWDDPLMVKIEDWEGKRVAEFSHHGTDSISTRLRVAVSNKGPLSFDKFDNLPEASGEFGLRTKTIEKLGKVVRKTLGYDCTDYWVVKYHGDTNAVEFVCTSKLDDIRIYAMPLKYR